MLTMVTERERAATANHQSEFNIGVSELLYVHSRDSSIPPILIRAASCWSGTHTVRQKEIRF